MLVCLRFVIWVCVVHLAVSQHYSSSPTFAADWPRWRGPDATGVSPETGWNSDWGDTGVPVLWKQNVGIGYSTVSVANERLITMGHHDGQETIICLNPDTGEEYWKHTYPAKLVDNLNKGGPASTPTIDAGEVLTVSRDGRLTSLDAISGKLNWETMLGQHTQAELPEWGFSSSVVVHGDRLLVESGGIACFRRQDGHLDWHVGPFKVGYGTPSVFTHQGQSYAASLNNEDVQIVALDRGEGVARSEWVTSFDTNSTTPIVRGDEVFISTGYQRGCVLLQFNGEKLTPIYEQKSMANHMNNCVYHDGYLYGIHGNSHTPSQCALRCIEWKTGKLQWSERGCGAGSLIMSDGKLIVLSDQGKLSLVRATPEKFEELASQDVLSGQCWTSPVLSNGRIYCRSSEGDLVCLDVR